MDPVAFLSRFFHVFSAILLMGGAMYTLLVLMPAARDLPDEAHAGLKERIAKKWRMILGIGILILLITGFYNYIVVMIPQHKGDGRYHMLMGIKILLAFVVFFLASALAGRSKGLAFIRANASRWLMILVLLSAAVVGIGSFLKVRGPAPAKTEQSAASGASVPGDVHFFASRP